jgi:hypothetical protein
MRAILFLVAASGCTFVAEGSGSTDTDADTETSSGPDTLQISSGPGSGSASSTSSGSASSGLTFSDSSTSSTSSESTGDASSSSSSSESSTGAAVDHPYVDCWPPSKQCEGSCVVSSVEGEDDSPSACAPDCDPGCPDAGELAGVCLPEIATMTIAGGVVAPVCVLPCGPGDCDPPMICAPLGSYLDARGEHPTVCMW